MIYLVGPGERKSYREGEGGWRDGGEREEEGGREGVTFSPLTWQSSPSRVNPSLVVVTWWC